MATTVDFTKLKTSWTKYDIVLVMDVISSVEKIEAYKAKEIVIDEPILRSFLGIRSLKDTIPSYWIDIQKYPIEKKLFALLSVLFTHHEVVNLFANKYANENMGGTFIIEVGKMFTNIRSALVEAGAALSNYRREDEVPYDFSLIYKNGEVGVLFKEVLKERINTLTKTSITNENFYIICLQNNFDKALGLTSKQFKAWLEGDAVLDDNSSNYVQSVQIKNFYSISEIELSFNNSKEIYFLGENGDGKSLVLMAIYLTFRNDFLLKLNNIEGTAKVVDMLTENPNFYPIGLDNSGKEYGLGKDIYLSNVFAYGTHRGRYSTDNPEQYGFMSLFSSEEKLLNPITWLSRQKAIEVEEELHGQTSLFESSKLNLSTGFIENMLCDLLEKEVSIKVYVDRVEFIEKGANPLSFDQLSEGYKSIVIFVCDLIFRLSQSVVEEDSINDLKGVVLVDEIDLHLHPKWQRVIIGKIRKIFPQLQFIFTTHSPTIIQGASEDAILYRVYRNAEDGKTRVSEPYLRKDLDHLMINSLVTSPLFGLDDARMDPEDDEADTSDSYLLHRINRKISEQLKNKRSHGKEFVSKSEIDELIDKLLKDDLGAND